MCVILVSPPKARPSLSTLQQCAAANPHGGGIAWVESGLVQYLKTDDVRRIHRTSQHAKGDVVVHFRIASVGGVCAELRHPFPVTGRAGLSDRSSAPAVLFQNGTWSDWRDAVARAEALGHKAPSGKMSDARAAAWLCHVHGRHEWLKEVGWSRWVYLNARELVLYGDWKEREGMRFSNLHWCGRDTSPPPHLACQTAKPPRQASLPFQPSPEFLATAARVRARSS